MSDKLDKLANLFVTTAGIIIMVCGVRVIALGVYHDNEIVGLVFGALYFGICYLLIGLAERKHDD